MAPDDLATHARALLDTNGFLTLGTVGPDGRPWTSPVYFAAAGLRDFYWSSETDAVHSRNLAERPVESNEVYDSSVRPYHGCTASPKTTALASRSRAYEMPRRFARYIAASAWATSELGSAAGSADHATPTLTAGRITVSPKLTGRRTVCARRRPSRSACPTDGTSRATTRNSSPPSRPTSASRLPSRSRSPMATSR